MFGTDLAVCLGAGFNPPILNSLFDGPAFNRAATAVETLDAVRFLALAADIKAAAMTPRGAARHQVKANGICFADRGFLGFSQILR
jgi:hypothetical protein